MIFNEDSRSITTQELLVEAGLLIFLKDSSRASKEERGSARERIPNHTDFLAEIE